MSHTDDTTDIVVEVLDELLALQTDINGFAALLVPHRHQFSELRQFGLELGDQLGWSSGDFLTPELEFEQKRETERGILETGFDDQP